MLVAIGVRPDLELSDESEVEVLQRDEATGLIMSARIRPVWVPRKSDEGER